MIASQAVRVVPRRSRRNRHFVQIMLISLGYMMLIAGAISMLIPFIWMIFTSFKPREEIFKMPPVIWTTRYTIQHYIVAVTRGKFDIYFKNSFIVSGFTTILTVAFTSMAGYAFSRLKWRLRDFTFMVVLATAMLPGLIALIPTFLIVKGTPLAGGNDIFGHGGTGWLDSYPGLILPAVGGGFNVFLIRQFFSTLPRELEDAARVDGCGEISIYSRIIMPLSKPVIAVVALFTFQGSWNDFLWPLVIIQSDNMRTIQLGLTLFHSQHNIDWGVLMAGTALATAPTVALFLLAQRYFVRGIALTGIKG
ncbi:MAG: carbohydrate ABC transporter permease [Anaerolineae bacterium]